MYYTCDWDAARASVRALAEFAPEAAITGHGQPMFGEALRDALRLLARDFDQRARPARGRYVRTPAVTDESGVVSVPPPVPDATPWALAGGAMAMGMVLGSIKRDR